MSTQIKKLIFVYNADSGLFNSLSDTAHKILSPETYSCNLCAITHGSFGMKKEWKEFLKSLNYSLEFLHRNELLTKYDISNVGLPAVFVNTNNSLHLLIDSPSINKCKTINDLKELIINKLS